LVRDTEPGMRELLDSLGARRGVDPVTLADAHAAREHRNSLVHGGPVARALTLGQVRSAVQKFFAYMPDDW
jgi:hypothetical protein